MYGDAYRKTHAMSSGQRKVMAAIMACRTARLGGHTEICDHCGSARNSYNSCRNRHCPKCQTMTKEEWLGKRKEELLPCGYFHMVFTVPHVLNPLVLANRRNEQVLDYLGRYTHRIAISNHRIIAVDNGEATFTYKDRQNNTTKKMTLSGIEFIRRFLLHVLPSRFMKIRYYGFLANICKKKSVLLIRRLIGKAMSVRNFVKETVQEKVLRLTGRDILLCPHCKQARTDGVPRDAAGTEYRLRSTGGHTFLQHLRDVLDRCVFFQLQTADNIKKLHIEADKQQTQMYLNHPFRSNNLISFLLSSRETLCKIFTTVFQ
jgi:hypothetical protein